jgi:3-deoxy-D-manno-octulosonic-acid transferase
MRRLKGCCVLADAISVLYSALVLALAPLLLAAFTWRYGLRRTLSGLGERFGLGLAPLREGGDRPEAGVVWVHAASVGEVKAVEPFLRALARRRPDVAVALTTTTVAGKELADRLGVAAAVRLAPVDVGLVVSRVMDAWHPRALLLVETELWPNWIRAAATRGVPTILLNGRLSDKAFGAYLLLRFFWSSLLKRFFAVGAQSPAHVERFLRLGADPARTSSTGNLKYDAPLPDLSERPALRQKYGFPADARIWVCGSLHPGEEEAVVGVFAGLFAADPALRLVLAPRQLERIAALRRLAEKRGLPCVLRSASEPGEKRVLLLDTLGELAEVYGLADFAFVGGSLVPRGGQNPLEPARWGVPVLFGPHMENFREMSELFLREGGAVRVSGAAALAEELRGICADLRRAAAVGGAARRVADSQRGAVERNLALLEKALIR